MSTQKSFDAILGKFKDGNALVQEWTDYTPGNAQITKPALTEFIADVESANSSVATTLGSVTEERALRAVLVFKIANENPACLEQRIRAIASYLESDPDNKAFSTTAKKVKSILKKIRPRYPKKAADAPRGKGKSPMEKSYTSAEGQGNNVIAQITRLGVAYAPANADLSVASMTTLVGSISTYNSSVATKLGDYSEAIKARLALYKGEQGLNKRQRAMLNYLASFAGLKKSDHYVQFHGAVKGA